MCIYWYVQLIADIMDGLNTVMFCNLKLCYAQTLHCKKLKVLSMTGHESPEVE